MLVSASHPVDGLESSVGPLMKSLRSSKKDDGSDDSSSSKFLPETGIHVRGYA